MSDLQDRLQGVFGELNRAREELDPRAWRVFIDIVTTRVGNECAKLVIADLLAADSSSEEKAA